MFMKSQRRIAAVAAVGAAALVLALTGCQSAVEQGGGNSTAEPVSGGTLSIAQSGDIQPANVLAGRAGNQGWASNVFETLTTRDSEGQPQPSLATKWTVAADGMSIELTIRDDVTFHSGRPMTADDVKFSIEATATPTNNSQVGYIGRSFAGVEVVSPTELAIQFSVQTPNVFDFFEYAYIVDSQTFAGLADGSQVVGTGPFTFESWTPGSEVTLLRNDDYWGKEPYLDGIDLAIITDSTAMLNAVRSGRTQVALAMNLVDVQTLKSNNAFTIVESTGSIYPFGINVTQAPWDNKEARQAVQYAIDRERISTQVFGGAALPSALFWDPSSPGYPKDLEQHFAYDPDKATQMLEDAGAAGSAIEITVIGLPTNTGVAEVIRNNLEAVGLKPTITVQEPATWDKNQVAGDLGTSFLPVHGINGLAPATLINVFPSLREGNPSKFWTAQYVELRDNLLTAGEDEAEQALRELSEYILDEAFTAAVVNAPGQVVQSNDVHDVGYTIRGYLDAGAAFVEQ